MKDERERLYSRAINEREYLPIRGKWAATVRNDIQRKKKRRRDKIMSISLVPWRNR